ncbi:MAG: NAD-dependent deacylase [Spirochaetes bacterium]|nr:NAD-dependent deacylase [Spirochaetota bacterium]
MEQGIERAAEMVRCARHVIALTGAGISTESGIPDFRSAGGLWQKYDPAEYASIHAFQSDPDKVWRMLFDMIDLTRKALPNPGHRALAELEEMGFLKCVVTQNIDNLHQAAGSVSVIEYHGNVSRLECINCGAVYGESDFNVDEIAEKRVPPLCAACKGVLKPGVIFFGEMIPRDAMIRSDEEAREADLVLVIGTSAVVYPAAGIPLIAKQHNAAIIEFNTESTDLTRYATDLFIMGMAGTTLPELARRLRS